MGFFKDLFQTERKARKMVPVEYKGPAGAVRMAKDEAAQMNASMDLMAEMQRVSAERLRLQQVGTPGEATITSITQNVAQTGGIPWHEVGLEVHVPGRDPYQASRRVMLELSTVPSFKPGKIVPVLVDPEDPSKVLITMTLSGGA